MKKEVDPLTVLRKRVSTVSTDPGVYRWLDSKRNVLYVGKAKNLRNRMQTYVQTGAKRSAWTEIMVRQISDFDATVVGTELEALMLETNLIKELRPKYNIMMKDDKNYVYVRISDETFPRVEVVRRMEDDRAKYFGPKTSAYEVRETLSFLRSLFPFRTCKMGIEVVSKDIPEKATSGQRPAVSSDANKDVTLSASEGRYPLDVLCKDRDRPTPCVDHHIKQCIAPCIGTVKPEEYRTQAIDGVVAFFQGKYQVAENILTERMAEAAKNKKFERAAKMRDQLKMLQSMREKQIVSDTSHADTDIIGAALLSGHAYVCLLKERDGKLMGDESFSLAGTADSLSQVLGQFLPQYYADCADLPNAVIVGEAPEGHEAISEWLKTQKGKKVELIVPERGKKSKLLMLAEKNADWKAKQSEAKWESETRKVEESLTSLQTVLSLPEVPRRIEGYDISHLGGTHAVGSMVVFIHGKPKRDHYRSFNIKSVKEGDIDDYKALAEVLRRRLKYVTQDIKKEEAVWKEKGVAIGKARKADQQKIEEIVKVNSNELGNDDLQYKQFIVARKDDNLVAMARLYAYAPKVLAVKTVWVAKEMCGHRFGQVLVRKLIASIDKGKVYATIHPDLEEYYGELGFRYVLKGPPELEAILDTYVAMQPKNPRGIIMMYDIKEHKKDASFSEVPDLLLIDGGKGQLHAVDDVRKELKLAIPLASLAKREEEIFVPGSSVSLLVPKDAPAQFLLQRIRDESHRFANSKREGRQDKTMFASKLDEIEGIGDLTKAALLSKYKTVDAIFAAPDVELSELLTSAQLKALRASASDTPR